MLWLQGTSIRLRGGPQPGLWRLSHYNQNNARYCVEVGGKRGHGERPEVANSFNNSIEDPCFIIGMLFSVLLICYAIDLLYNTLGLRALRKPIVYLRNTKYPLVNVLVFTTAMLGALLISEGDIGSWCYSLPQTDRRGTFL